jgi:hypothetical protein
MSHTGTILTVFAVLVITILWKTGVLNNFWNATIA